MVPRFARLAFGSALALVRGMPGASMSIQPAFDDLLHDRPGIHVFCKRVPACLVEPMGRIVEEVDLREYIEETLDVAAMTASAGPDAWNC